MGNESSHLSHPDDHHILKSSLSRSRSSTQTSTTSTASSSSQTSTTSSPYVNSRASANTITPSSRAISPSSHPHKQSPTPRPTPLLLSPMSRRFGSNVAPSPLDPRFAGLEDPRSPRPVEAEGVGTIRVGFPYYEEVLMVEGQWEKSGAGRRERLGRRFRGLSG